MTATGSVSDALFVLEDATPRRTAAETARRVLGSDVHWSIVALVPDHPRVTSGATGFAAPVLSPDEMDAEASSDLIAGDAAAAETAGGFGDQPVRQNVLRGDPVAAIRRHVETYPTDLLVVHSTDLAATFVDAGFPAVLVVAPASPG